MYACLELRLWCTGVLNYSRARYLHLQLRPYFEADCVGNGVLGRTRCAKNMLKCQEARLGEAQLNSCLHTHQKKTKKTAPPPASAINQLTRAVIVRVLGGCFVVLAGTIVLLPRFLRLPVVPPCVGLLRCYVPGLFFTATPPYTRG